MVAQSGGSEMGTAASSPGGGGARRRLGWILVVMGLGFFSLCSETLFSVSGEVDPTRAVGVAGG